MNLKSVKHLTLSEAARLCHTTIEALCDWLLENPVRLEARSEFSGKYTPLAEESYEKLLAAADKKIEYVVFIYPPEMNKFRRLPKRQGELRGKIRRSDEQTVSWDHLRIPIDEFNRVQKIVTDEIGIGENYGVKKVRSTRHKWNKLHDSILSAANELLRENPTKYAKKSGEPVVAKLANGIDEMRGRWPTLAGEPYGTSHRNLVDQLGKMRDRLKAPKKQS